MSSHISSKISPKLKQIKWHKIGARPADLQKCIQFAYGAGSDFGKAFGTKYINNQFYFFDGRTTGIYFSEQDFDRFSNSLKEKLNQHEFLKEHHKNMVTVCELSLKQADKIVAKSVLVTNPEDLIANLIDYENKVWRYFYPYAWSLWFLTALEDLVKNSLQTVLVGQEKIEEVLRVIAQPLLITPVMAAEIEILKLAQGIEDKDNDQVIATKASELSEEFGWMSVYNFDDEPRPASYYTNEAEKLLSGKINTAAKLKDLQEIRKTNEEKYQKLLKQISDPLLRDQMELLHEAGYLRDAREETRDRLTLIERKLYEKIAETTKLSLKDVLYLATDEIKLLLSSGAGQDLAGIAKERQKRFVLAVQGDFFQAIHEKIQVEQVAALLFSESETNFLKGQVAFKQEKPVQGRVKIVLSNKELDKVEVGDILVASMTKPDYIGAMKKAAGFITDEGGLLSHAAIVAREMRKPCIIGTKVATQVLRDGDLVEVDADQGVVKVIKKAGE